MGIRTGQRRETISIQKGKTGALLAGKDGKNRQVQKSRETTQKKHPLGQETGPRSAIRTKGGADRSQWKASQITRELGINKHIDNMG